MSPYKCQFLQRGSEKSISDDFFCAKLGGGGGGEDMVICWNAGSTLQTFVQKISLLSLLLFLRDSHFSFSSISVILPVSKQ